MKKKEIPDDYRQIITDQKYRLTDKQIGALISGAPDLNSLACAFVNLLSREEKEGAMVRLEDTETGVDWSPWVEFTTRRIRRMVDFYYGENAEV